VAIETTKKKNSELSAFDNTKADIYPYYIYVDILNHEKSKETKKLYDSLALYLKDLSATIFHKTKIPASNFRFFWDGIGCLEYGPAKYTQEHSISICLQVKLSSDSWQESSIINPITINPMIPQTVSNNCVVLHSRYRIKHNIFENEISINNLYCKSFAEDDEIIETYKNLRNNDIIKVMQNFVQITPKIVSKNQLKFYAANTHVIFTGK